jgi:hypothetical protein
MPLIADRKVIRATRANEDRKDCLANKDLLDLPDLVANRASVALMEHQDLLDRRVS